MAAGLSREAKHAYALADVKKWLRVFLFRFFEISQFKRSALPNSPKVVSGGSLSPRGDWRAPSDGNARVWLEELEANVPDKVDASLRCFRGGVSKGADETDFMER